MSGEMAAAGDLAMGALVARQFEPHAGEVSHGAQAGHGLCLNCGTALVGSFCHACGQNGHLHRTIGSIGHDILHGVFHFEGKIWHTLPMLVFRPGALTRRYIAGERARFVSPMALFLFFAFLMFATLHTFAGEPELPMGGNRQEIARHTVDANLTRARKRVADAQARDRQRGLSTPSAELKSEQEALAALETAKRSVETMKGGEDDFVFSDIKTGWKRLDKGLHKANENPNLALYKLQSSAYKYSWALIPISVPFVAMLFLWRRRFGLYDHAIFVTYNLAFMLLLVTALTVARSAGAPGWIFGASVIFVPPVFMFAQLRGAYSLRKRSALWRTVALTVFAWVALILFVCLLLALGLLG
ncbi:DUF3667 domain-containing protein [Sphingomonas aracearum]|uniref:DUF3667 domain-containing protein n=1 Tax=Sphingomonas aracearum TaxID=2283317 RepID=A0A369VSB2_9SPHN|nr:DUF3667 domain-containing protein [Sphingomonas aracearum]RDE04759.1 DUF3667 domain-containing protein [Sphingomonas aracearum]